MRILYHSRTFALGGERVHIDSIVNNLRALGNKVFLIQPIYNKNIATILSGLKKKIPLISDILDILYDIKEFLRIKKYKNYDLIYERHSLFNKAGAKYAKKYKIPLFLEVNAPYYSERTKYGNLALKKIAKKWELYSLHSADKIFCVSNKLKDILIKMGTREDKIIVTRNCIDKNLFNPKPKSKNNITIGFIGSLRDWHNVSMLTKTLNKVMDKYKDVAFILVGRSFKSIKLTHKDRFKLINTVKYSSIPQYIDLFDIGILPGSTEYSCPMKLVEYMAMGKAVLAPNLENIRELVKNNNNGLLLIPEDEKDFFLKLDKLIKSKALRKRLGKNARKYILDNNYTWQDNAKKIIRVYNQLEKQ
ncbi:MAG: glycosyltransferase family 4 protein [Nanoarchaeota archaeon]|nr:glycosyltransferase family 4 protein [Nanoarchaeota archaeon]